MKKSFYIILGIVITVTIAWYIFLYNSIGGLSGICVCPPITEDIYQGPNWPTLFPGGGCGDCGLPESPSQFFSQIYRILIPAIIILLIYGVYKGVRKLFSKPTPTK